MADTNVVLVEPDPWGQAVSNNLESYNPYTQLADETDRSVTYDTMMKAGKATDALTAVAGALNDVSRPVLGTLSKPNTHAFVQVIGSDGNTIKCFNNIGHRIDPASSGYYLHDKKEPPLPPGGFGFDTAAIANSPIGSLFGGDDKKGGTAKDKEAAGGPNSPIWTDWLLQSVQEARIEKTQVVETFGDSYFYAYGQRPRSINFSGMLMNTVDYNWRAIFWKNWDEYFRATKLVEKNARLYIQWDDIIVEGFPVNAVCSEVSDSPNALKFSFTLFVTRYINLSAQSGFLHQRYMKIAQLRAGSGLGMADKKNGYRMIGGEAFDPKGFNYIGPDGSSWFELGGGAMGLEGALNLRSGAGAQFEKFSIIGQVGPQLGNTLKRWALDIPRAREFYDSTATGRSLINSVGFAADALQRYNKKPDHLQAQFLSSFFRRLGTSVLQSVALDLSDTVEDALGVRRGEISSFFGHFFDTVEAAAVLTDDEGRTYGNQFRLSSAARMGTVNAALASWVNSGSLDTLSSGGVNDGSGWGIQAGGISIVNGDIHNIDDVVTYGRTNVEDPAQALIQTRPEGA